jgi:hypothetical protein
MKEIPNELAPCGVFCGACPSFPKTCLGCASDSKEQKRKSKWDCKIRDCCYNKNNLSFCIECEEFPCEIHKKKLIDSHPEDNKFKYRHEIPDIFIKLRKMGIEEYLKYQNQRWSCSNCDGTVKFYHYKCDKCGKEILI